MDLEHKFSLMSVMYELGFDKEVCVIALHQIENGCVGIGQSIINALTMIETQKKINQSAATSEPEAPAAPIEPVV